MRSFPRKWDVIVLLCTSSQGGPRVEAWVARGAEHALSVLSATVAEPRQIPSLLYEDPEYKLYDIFQASLTVSRITDVSIRFERFIVTRVSGRLLQMTTILHSYCNHTLFARYSTLLRIDSRVANCIRRGSIREYFE
eukprot:g60225.t1